MVNPEIKKCPFCGKRARVGEGSRRKTDHETYKGRAYGFAAGEWIWKPNIGCQSCGIAREFDSVEAALEWWNTRSTS